MEDVLNTDCRCAPVIVEAIEKQRPATLLLRDGEHEHRLPVELVDECTEPGGGIWVRVARGNGTLLARMLDSGTTVEGTFTLASSKVFFDTAVVRKRRGFWLNRTVLIRQPHTVNIVDQRKSVREWVPADAKVFARVYPPPGETTLRAVTAQPWDLSLGGASLVCPATAELAALKPGQNLRVVIRADGKRMRFAAMLVTTQTLSSSSIRIGVRFTTPDSEALTHLRKLLRELELLRYQREFEPVTRREKFMAILPAGAD